MSTLVSSEAKFQRAYIPTSALAKSVRFDEDIMHVSLTDGRVITYRSFGFPCCATPRRKKEISMKSEGAAHRCIGLN